MRVGLKAVLVSPHFLFLEESRQSSTTSRSPAGCPYFLWSSMPDEELLALAEQGKLSQTEATPRAGRTNAQGQKGGAFTENFAGQWLNLRKIDDTLPDPALYPRVRQRAQGPRW